MTTRWPNNMLIKPILTWPGEPSTWQARKRAPFRATARVLQIDMDERYFRIDGFPRADARSNGPGVILTFDAFGGSLSYPCDTFDDWQDNVRAIALALEALRKVDRYGVTKRGEQYAGFKALPPGGIALAGARRLHPDQPNGTTRGFQMLQDAKRAIEKALADG